MHYQKRKCFCKVMLVIGFVSLLFCAATEPVYADPKEEQQTAVDELKGRIMKLNNDISTAVVRQKELESEVEKVNQEMEGKQKTVREATKKKEKLEKEIGTRARAIQVNESRDGVWFLKLGELSKALLTLQSLQEIQMADEKRAKEYQQLVDQLGQQEGQAKEKQQEMESKQEELRETTTNLEVKKHELQGELSENQELLKTIKEQEQEQEETLKEEREGVVEQVTAGFFSNVRLPEEDSQGSELPSGTAKEVILEAEQFIGVPYVWGGTTPSGFDCSGLMQYVFARHGISLPRVSQAQQQFAKTIPLSQLRPGDLVFWGDPAHHVGLYIGEGFYIHAPQPGENVKITHESYHPFQSAGRVIF
ncbi:hypothetical protein NRIC_17000 [Enterococcus florum]|uniref:NlpC/P60 domain-containing protein n=1 Tax=Enterococcus florum TaxID=2480627 RepID=A0A4V0WPG8_9ENTE|nr:C40 family peptidase [Enterococcus florum]GCF93809.1 hypothetical protein NRIC_17000 [Enterococcus florum]